MELRYQPAIEVYREPWEIEREREGERERERERGFIGFIRAYRVYGFRVYVYNERNIPHRDRKSETKGEGDRERERERERVRESYRNTRSLPGAKLQLFRLRVRLLVGFPGLLPLLWRSLLRDCIG